MDPWSIGFGAVNTALGIGSNKAQARQNRYQREWDDYFYHDQKATQMQQRAEDRVNYLGDIDQQFVRMRDAATKGGFNPLTAMGAAPVPMASSPGMGGFSSTPLAGGSPGNDMIANGLATIGDELSGNAAERRAREALQTDLLRIQVDQLKAQAKARPTNASGQVSFATKPARSSGVRVSTGKPDVLKVGQQPFYNEGTDREHEAKPSTSGAGLTTVENGSLPGPIHLAGNDGEPWGLDELLAAVVQGVPQVMYHVAKNNFGTDHIAPGLKQDAELLKTIKTEVVGAAKTYVPGIFPTSRPASGRNPQIGN